MFNKGQVMTRIQSFFQCSKSPRLNAGSTAASRRNTPSTTTAATAATTGSFTTSSTLSASTRYKLVRSLPISSRAFRQCRQCQVCYGYGPNEHAASATAAHRMQHEGLYTDPHDTHDKGVQETPSCCTPQTRRTTLELDRMEATKNAEGRCRYQLGSLRGTN